MQIKALTADFVAEMGFSPKGKEKIDAGERIKG